MCKFVMFVVCAKQDGRIIPEALENIVAAVVENAHHTKGMLTEVRAVQVDEEDHNELTKYFQ